MFHIPFLSPEAPYTLLLVSVLLLIIFRPLKFLRRSLINTGVFYVVCFFGDLFSGLIANYDLPISGNLMRQMAVFGQGLAVIRFGGLALFNVALPRMGINIAGILADILVIIGYIIWVFIRLSLAGVELTHLVTTSAIITAVLAISMQDTLGNLLGGLALQMDNSLEIGDWIKIDDLSGQVIEIQWRYTALLTRNGEKVVVPNSQLMKGRYYVLCDKNSDNPAWRRSIWFNIDLSTSPARVIHIVDNAISSARISNVSLSLLPNCVLMEFAHGYARYALRYWMLDPKLDDPTDSEVRTHVLAALQREGIRMATDDHVIHLVKEGEGHRAEVRSRELKHRLDAISRIEIFNKLSDDERADLAQRLTPAPFARGDIMTRQGANAHWLYIVVSGEAEAWWQPPEGEPRLLEKRGPGSVFGEIGLMTGAPRRATVIATNDVEAYRLDKAAFEHIIRARPELADSMSAILAKRVQQFTALEMGYLERRSELSSRAPGSAAIGQKIKEFFGL